MNIWIKCSFQHHWVYSIENFLALFSCPHPLPILCAKQPCEWIGLVSEAFHTVRNNIIYVIYFCLLITIGRQNSSWDLQHWEKTKEYTLVMSSSTVIVKMQSLKGVPPKFIMHALYYRSCRGDTVLQYLIVTSEAVSTCIRLWPWMLCNPYSDERDLQPCVIGLVETLETLMVS